MTSAPACWRQFSSADTSEDTVIWVSWTMASLWPVSLFLVRRGRAASNCSSRFKRARGYDYFFLQIPLILAQACGSASSRSTNLPVAHELFRRSTSCCRSRSPKRCRKTAPKMRMIAKSIIILSTLKTVMILTSSTAACQFAANGSRRPATSRRAGGCSSRLEKIMLRRMCRDM